MLFDNSGDEPKIVASEAGYKLRIMMTEQYENLLEGYGEI
jgi:hypothetical protein